MPAAWKVESTAPAGMLNVSSSMIVRTAVLGNARVALIGLESSRFTVCVPGGSWVRLSMTVTTKFVLVWPDTMRMTPEVVT